VKIGIRNGLVLEIIIFENLRAISIYDSLISKTPQKGETKISVSFLSAALLVWFLINQYP
jgi:hypothetical protein